MNAGSIVSALASFALCCLLGVLQAQRVASREKALCAMSVLIGELQKQAVIGGQTLRQICMQLSGGTNEHMRTLAHIFLEQLGSGADRSDIRLQLRRLLGLGEAEADLGAWLIAQVQSTDLARVRQAVQYAEGACAGMLEQYRTHSSKQRSLYLKLGALGGLVCFILCI